MRSGMMALFALVAMPLAAQERVADAVPAPSFQVISPGRSPEVGPPSNFTGSVVASSRFKGTGGAKLAGATVMFQPGARTHWHSHPMGQLLIVTAGRGWVQAEGEPVREVKPGDVVWTGPGVKHWHGATKSTSMTHIGVAEAVAGQSVIWLEPVSDAQYKGPQ